MKSLFNNNIITNPKGWAKSCVGTAVRYRLAQIMTVFIGVGYFVYILMLLKPLPHWILYFSLGCFYFIIAVEFPLFYLRALRAYYLSEGTNDESIKMKKKTVLITALIAVVSIILIMGIYLNIEHKFYKMKIQLLEDELKVLNTTAFHRKIAAENLANKLLVLTHDLAENPASLDENKEDFDRKMKDIKNQLDENKKTWKRHAELNNEVKEIKNNGFWSYLLNLK